MKKLLLLPMLFFLLVSCNNKSPEQHINELFEKQKQESMRKEIYVDSLLKVAYGMGEYQYLKENRLNALEKLRQELPEMNAKWDSIAVMIQNYE